MLSNFIFIYPAPETIEEEECEDGDDFEQSSDEDMECWNFIIIIIYYYSLLLFKGNSSKEHDVQRIRGF